MAEIIGGVFALPETISNPTPLATGLKVANARSAIKIIIEKHRPKNVWIPDYCCQSIMGTKSYQVDDMLNVKTPLPVQKDDMIIFVNYFGKGIDNELVEEANHKGAITVEDHSQNFFAEDNPNANYHIRSVTKTFGVPDGAIMSPCFNVDLEDLPTEWWTKSLHCRALRKDFDEGCDNTKWYDLWKDVKRTPIGNYKMSELSEKLLNRCYNSNEIKKRYKENFSELESIMGPCKFLSDRKHIPTGYLLESDNRNQLQQKFFEQRIYPPIHWDCDHPLSKRMLTIPCDYRYNMEDMRRVATVI
ncbi:MAG: hypothetical protein ACW99G_03530 [Candidatus Thorarchaeota archaeon]|jgi:hypothetical protein